MECYIDWMSLGLIYTTFPNAVIVAIKCVSLTIDGRNIMTIVHKMPMVVYSSMYAEFMLPQHNIQL